MFNVVVGGCTISLEAFAGSYPPVYLCSPAWCRVHLRGVNVDSNNCDIACESATNLT